jgi:hypothetical protein
MNKFIGIVLKAFWEVGIIIGVLWTLIRGLHMLTSEVIHLRWFDFLIYAVFAFSVYRYRKMGPLDL